MSMVFQFKMLNILFKFKSHRFVYFLTAERNCSSFGNGFSKLSLECHSQPSSENSSRHSGRYHLVIRRIRSSANVSGVSSSEAFCDEGKKNENSIIYNGALTYQVKGVKVFTCITSLGGILIQPLMVQNILNGNNVPLGVAVFCCVGFFTFLTPFLIHLITKKYVTEIWYNSATDTYTATVLSFFLQKIHITFKIEDVTVPSMLPIFSTMNIKGKPVFIISDSFLEMEHYIKMMGYDKPMNMKLNAPPDTLEVPRDKAKSEI